MASSFSVRDTRLFHKGDGPELFVIECQEHRSAPRQINRADPAKALRSSPVASVSGRSPSRCCLAPMPLVCETASTTRISVRPRRRRPPLPTHPCRCSMATAIRARLPDSRRSGRLDGAGTPTADFRSGCPEDRSSGSDLAAGPATLQKRGARDRSFLFWIYGCWISGWAMLLSVSGRDLCLGRRVGRQARG